MAPGAGTKVSEVCRPLVPPVASELYPYSLNVTVVSALKLASLRVRTLPVQLEFESGFVSTPLVFDRPAARVV